MINHFIVIVNFRNCFDKALTEIFQFHRALLTGLEFTNPLGFELESPCILINPKKIGSHCSASKIWFRQTMTAIFSLPNSIFMFFPILCAFRSSNLLPRHQQKMVVMTLQMTTIAFLLTTKKILSKNTLRY